MTVDPSYAKSIWAEARTIDGTTLGALLADAEYQCLEYAPNVVPPTFDRAVVLQARELWQAAQRDGDLIGTGDGFAVRARPLSGAVKSLLRPRKGVPTLG